MRRAFKTIEALAGIGGMECAGITIVCRDGIWIRKHVALKRALVIHDSHNVACPLVRYAIDAGHRGSAFLDA